MASSVALPQQLYMPSGEQEGGANVHPYGTGENTCPHGTEIARPCDAGENICLTVRSHGTEQNISEKSDIWNGHSAHMIGLVTPSVSRLIFIVVGSIE